MHSALGGSLLLADTYERYRQAQGLGARVAVVPGNSRRLTLEVGHEAPRLTFSSRTTSWLAKNTCIVHLGEPHFATVSGLRPANLPIVPQWRVIFVSFRSRRWLVRVCMCGWVGEPQVEDWVWRVPENR